ncbi:MAG: hypothetical protein WA373_14705 [Burkholderiales bacterium]
MDQQQAISHLKTACMLANQTDAALLAEWNSAKAKLGAAIPGAGHPDIKEIPNEHTDYLQKLQQVDWVANSSQPGMGLHGATFKLIEIDPLLAYQFIVDTSRSGHHCDAFSKPPKMDELIPCCLPMVLPSGEYHYQVQPQSVIVTSRSLNLKMMGQGITTNMAGINFGWLLPVVHVVRLHGRCYLHNGFHRAYGARLAGATHIPCVFRDVESAQAANIIPGATFDLPLLESDNPPTVAHFSQGRAHSVTLRATTRILHVTWAEYAMYDE